MKEKQRLTESEMSTLALATSQMIAGFDETTDAGNSTCPQGYCPALPIMETPTSTRRMRANNGALEQEPTKRARLLLMPERSGSAFRSVILDTSRGQQPVKYVSTGSGLMLFDRMILASSLGNDEGKIMLTSSSKSAASSASAQLQRWERRMMKNEATRFLVGHTDPQGTLSRCDFRPLDTDLGLLDCPTAKTQARSRYGKGTTTRAIGTVL